MSMVTAADVMAWCRRLAKYTEEPGYTTRTFLSPPMRQVHHDLCGWLRSLGLEPWLDAAGNLRCEYPGASPGARSLLIGSHLDTVPRAGAFDGILGVVLAIALVENLQGRPLSYAIEILGFSEEEGVRFGVPFIGSRAYLGTLGTALLERADSTGVTVSQCIANFGLLPTTAPQLVGEPAGYLEFHIEQGPVLESIAAPLGIVTAIAGQSRYTLCFEGHANHAGTTPMALRQDALVGAAEFIVAVERHACGTDGLVATVGQIQAEPGAGNIIPGRVTLSLDVRHASDAIREAAVQALLENAESIAHARGLQVTSTLRTNQTAAPMDARLTAMLSEAVGATGHSQPHLVSGAGHDAMILAPHIPSAMLFLRSPGGLSHHPDEAVLEEDVQAALDAGAHFLELYTHA